MVAPLTGLVCVGFACVGAHCTPVIPPFIREAGGGEGGRGGGVAKSVSRLDFPLSRTKSCSVFTFVGRLKAVQDATVSSNCWRPT